MTRGDNSFTHQTNSKSSAKLENKYENPNDPLYIHHSDQPGAVLVMQLLNNDNYDTWSRAMIMALSTKNKGLINGTIKQPLQTSIIELQQWTRCNNLVKSWLLNSISQDIRASVIYNELASDIWTELKERFSHVNSVHLFHIEQAIHDCIQDGITINAYYTKLKGLWDERDSLCSVPSCTCGTVKEVLQFQQNQKTMKFLMGLNETYATVCGQILLMDPLPNVNWAYSLILQDEKQRLVFTGKNNVPEATAFAVRDNSHGSGRNFALKNPHLKCDRCDKIGHTSKTCRSHLKCDFCGWKGHTIDVCRKLQKVPMLIMGAKSGTKANHADANIAAAPPPSSLTLTPEQYHNPIPSRILWLTMLVSLPP